MCVPCFRCGAQAAYDAAKATFEADKKKPKSPSKLQRLSDIYGERVCMSQCAWEAGNRGISCTKVGDGPILKWFYECFAWQGAAIQ